MEAGRVAEAMSEGEQGAVICPKVIVSFDDEREREIEG